jgi:hypothetical protein
VDSSQPPHDGDVLSSDLPHRARRPRRGLVAGLLTLALLVAGASGVALAADRGSSTPTASTGGSPTATPSAAPDRGRGDRHGWRGPRGRHGDAGMFGLLRALHGELVVPKAGGGFETVLVQRGRVTAVSAASISVKSADGFTATYDVTAATVVNATRDGITSIAKDAQVVVLARKTSAGGTALRVVDLSRFGGLPRGDGGGHRPRGTQSPSPDSTTTTGSSATGV